MLRPELDALDDECGEAIAALHEALKRSEEAGGQWRPQSRLARTALKAINWR
jgi:hypothetical protein